MKLTMDAVLQQARPVLPAASEACEPAGNREYYS